MADGKSIGEDLQLFAECFVSPSTGQRLREVGTAGLATVIGSPGFFPVVRRRLLFANRAAAESDDAGTDASFHPAARWLGGLVCSENGLSGSTVLELMPGEFSLADELGNAGGKVIGVLCPTDRDAPATMPAAVVPTFVRIPAREEAFGGILMLDPRLWRTGVTALLGEAARLLKPGGRLWMLAPVKGGPLHGWMARFDRLGLMRRAIRGRIEQSLRPASADGAAGVATWLATALRKLRKWDGMLDQPAFDALVASAGFGNVRLVLPEIALISIEKPTPQGSDATAAADDWRVPSNFRAPDSSEAAIRRDTEYALSVFATYVRPVQGGVAALHGKTVLELGPGNNLATCLCMASFGARTYVVDRYPAPWFGDYHSKLYASVRDELRRRFPDANAAPFDLCLEFQGHPSGSVSQLACPAEKIALPDASVDFTFSCAVLEHVSDAALSARELARITRPGGMAVHQVDFRDHRDFSRPLEYLLLGCDEFGKLFDSCHAECGNRIRPAELSRFLTEAGFGILRMHGNCQPEPAYLADFLPRLRAAVDSEYRDLPEEELRESGALVIARRNPAA